MPYPFDPEIRELVTDRLYKLLPELYRLRDFNDPVNEPKKWKQTEPGLEELYRFLYVVAAPLAEVRQSIDELHANLFVDTSADWALPYLAELVDLTLIFPEARANRRDLRSAVAFRRRKGTPDTLERLGNELSERIVATQEGFKLLLVSQDLDFLRPAHGIPSLVSPLIGEAATGPLDRHAHVVDIRPPTAQSGRYHPRQISHWMHATALFPLREGYPFARPPNVDRRFHFYPLEEMVALRIRKERPDDPLRTDLVRAEHFRAEPWRYFDQTGLSAARFSVRLAGIPAGVARAERGARLASRLPAHPVLARTRVGVRLLDFDRSRRSDAVEIAVVAAPRAGLLPVLGAHEVRGTIAVAANGAPTFTAGANTPLAAPFVALLQLRRPTGAGTAFFTGGTLMLSGEDVEAERESADTDLAREGYLRGALFVEIPPLWIEDAGGPNSGRWLYLAADGSLYDAQSPAAQNAGAAPDVPLASATQLPVTSVSVGPHPAWPPLQPSHVQTPLAAAPPAPWRSPVVLHGGSVLERNGGNFDPLAAPTTMAITFAMFSQGAFTPFVRIVWNTSDPTSATAFEIIGPAGVATTEAQAAAALRVFLVPQPGDPPVWHVLQEQNDVEIVVRFESASTGILLPPCEVAFTTATGTTTLVHLPELESAAPTHAWASSLAFASRIVRVQEDGSTAFFGTYDVARPAYGRIAPLREPSPLLRRQVRQRTLCGWKNEVGPQLVPPTPSGKLDIDPEHGLFALALADTLVAYPRLGGQTTAPAMVTVDAQEGYSQHLGVRPSFRQPLLGVELRTPTRFVLGGGRYHDGAPGSVGTSPRHETLAQALAAIQAMPPHELEVIQIEDSATYDGAIAWPTNITTLVIQSAEGERPLVRLPADVPSGAAQYELLRITGVGIAGVGGVTPDVALPLCERIELDFVTIHDGEQLLTVPGPGEHVTHVAIRFSILGRLLAAGRDAISISDSVIDASNGLAVEATRATVSFERVTVVADEGSLPPLGVGGPPLAVDVLVLSASEAVFDQAIRALDRFHGCIRYSRVEPGSETPRRHRVVEDEPRFVSRDRSHAAHLRLSERCPRSILVGAEDGSEMGAFHRTRLVQHTAAVHKRLVEFTPAGMRTGLIRMD
jgi:hypothetical protein